MNGVYIAVYLSLTLAFSNFRSKDALLTKPDQDNTNATLEGKLSKETDVDTRVSLYPNPSVCPLKCVCQVKSMYCYYTIPDVIPSSAEDVTLMAKSWAEFKDQKRFCHKTWSTVKTLELVFAFSSAFGHNILVNEIDCLEQLQTLKLNNMYANLRFSNSAFSDLQNLKTLDLSVSDVDISSLTDTLAVPKILPNLTTLILKGLERYFRPLQLNQSFIESFSNRQLQHIDLSEQKLEFYFYNISMLCNRLKTLNLSYSIIDVTRMKPENCHSLELIDISGSNLLERSFEDHKHGGRYYKRCINKFVPLAEGLGFHLPRRVIASSMFRAPHEFGVRYDYEIINCTVYLDLCCTEELVYKYNSYSPNNFHFVFASQCLKFIDLSENTIDIINADAIKFLTNLENVDLSNNEFGYESNFHAVPLSETNLGTVFYYNKNLLVVNLAGNHLPTLPGDTFASNPKLTNINLSHNSFSQIHFKISHLIHLEKLDLRHNNIRFLDSNSRNELDELYRRQIETRRTLNESKTLQILLDGNPFLCECYLYEFCLWFEAAPFLETTKHNSYCVVNEKMDSHAVDAAEEDCQRHMFTPTYFQYLYIKCSIFVERNALKLSIGAGILILTSLGICARSYYIKTLNQRFFKTKPLRKGSESKRDSPGSALGAPENGEESSRPGSFLQLEDRRSLVTDYQHILDASESVGKLSGFGYTGTCFRVGENYIMTAWHVINDIVREGKPFT